MARDPISEPPPADRPDDAEEVPTAPPRSRRGRSAAVVVLGVATLLLVLVSSVVVWSHRLLLNTDAWVATVGGLADDEEITDLVAERLTEQLLTATDAEAQVRDALPDQAAILAGPLTAAAGTFVTDAVAAVLASPQFGELWREANRLAHETVVAVLREEPVAGLQTTDGTIVLDLLPVMSQVLQRVDDVAPDLLTDGRPVPDVTYDTPPDEARAALSEALGVELPDGFGTIEIVQSDELAAAQTAVAVFDRLAWVLPLLSIALGAVTIWLARDRRRAALVLFVGLAGTAVATLAAGRAVRNLVIDLVGDPEARQAAAVTLSTVLGDLRSTAWLLVAVGVVAALVAWLAGDGQVARSLRTRVGDLGQDRDTAVPWVAEHREPLLVAGVAAGCVVLLVADVTFALLGVVLLAVGAWSLGLWVLSGRADTSTTAVASRTAEDAPS